jgi:hypothetical protein
MLLITEIGVRTWTCAEASPMASGPTTANVAAAIMRAERVFMVVS